MVFFKKQIGFGSVVFTLLLAFSCKPKVIKLQSPPNYDFSKPLIDKLDQRILEISGIVWDKKKDEFIAHNDEKGTLFFLDKDTRIVKRELAFGPKGDYEDVALYKETPYVLKSDGSLTRIVTDSTGTPHVQDAGRVPLSGLNDFETLYLDESRNALIMVCKNCVSDTKATVSAYAYYPDSIGFDNKPVFTFNAEQVKSLSPKKTSKFQPSAAAVHPGTKKLYILSSASNQLAVADLNGNVEAVYILAKKLFPQPEGLTFKGNGDMFISNEGVGEKATLIKFAFIQPPQQ